MFLKKVILLLIICVLFSFSAKGEEQNAGEPIKEIVPRPQSEVTETGSLSKDVVTLPTQTELSDQALETYAYLLFIEAIFDEDEAALLEAVPLLTKSRADSSIWLDGGLWLTSRKSPNSVIYLENAVKAYPDDMSLKLLYADALGDHGMVDRGIQLMRDYLKENKDSMDAKIELALLLAKDNKFEEAQKIFASISNKDRNGLINYYQAKVLIGMGNFAEAIPWLRRALKDMPNFVEAWSELGYLYEKEGNYREARNVYEKMQKLNAPEQDISLRLINTSLKLKQPDRAVQYARKGPDTLPFKISAAHMFMETGHYLQAENILKQIAAKPSAPLEVYLLLADIVYEQRKNLDQALSWLDKVPPAQARDQRVVILRIQLTTEAGKMADALALADKAFAEYPDSPEIADLRIRLLAKDKKQDQALEAAGEAYKKWPNNPGISFIYGSLLAEAGKKVEALQVMEDLAKNQPDNYQALNYIGYTLADENRDLERALELLKRANELAPNQSYIIDSLAWALYRSGQYGEALKEIKRAISLDNTTDAAIWEHYGDIAAQLGKKEEARRAYRKAIELKPANAAQVKNKLSSL